MQRKTKAMPDYCKEEKVFYIQNVKDWLQFHRNRRFNAFLSINFEVRRMELKKHADVLFIYADLLSYLHPHCASQDHIVKFNLHRTWFLGAFDSGDHSLLLEINFLHLVSIIQLYSYHF